MDSTVNNTLPSKQLNEIIKVQSQVNSELLQRYNHPHRIEFGCFLIVVNGEATLHINLSEYVVSSHSFVTILPGSIIYITNRSDDFHCEIIAFSPNFTQDSEVIRNVFTRLETIMAQPIIKLDNDEKEWIREFYVLFLKSYNRVTTYSTAYIAVLTNLLETLFCVISAIYDRYRSITPSKVLTRKEEIVHNYAQLVLKHYDKERSVGFYADKLCITSTYLNALVKEVRGVSASKFISDAVILYAKSRLKGSSDTIQQISDQLNFPNSSFFAKYFKREVGVSPTDYREQEF